MPDPLKLDSFLGASTLLPTAQQAAINYAQQRRDGWKNILSGMGTSRDKRRYTSFDATKVLDETTLAHLYNLDGLVARIVDTMPDDMTREWGKALNDPVNKKTKKGEIESELDKIDASTYVNRAAKWARLFGGALLYIGAVDGNNPEQPINLKNIKSIDFMRIIEMPDIFTYECEYETDINSSDFGKIKLYSVQFRAGDVWVKRKIHASRCIPFFGKSTPKSDRSLSVDQRYWGISEIQPCWDYVRDFSAAMGSTSAILMEFIIGKYKLSDLDEILAKGGEARLKTRIEAMEMSKSTIHSVLIGPDEEYTRDSATVTGIADLLDRFMMNLSAVTQYPVTKLFGRSPAGMNATGENDLKNYYDAVRSQQKAYSPYIQNLVNMVAAMKNMSGEYPWEWNPLFQLTEEGRANVDRIKAETARTYADADQRMLQEGVVLPEDIYKMRYEETLGRRDFDKQEQELLEKSIANAKAFNEAQAESTGGIDDETNTQGGNKKIQKNPDQSTT